MSPYGRFRLRSVCSGVGSEDERSLGRPCLWRFLWAAWMSLTVFVAPARDMVAQVHPGDATTLRFDLPAKPLAHALMAYSAVTGVEIFYNAALAEGRHSTPVTGTLTPPHALQILLQGTGLMPRPTGSASFTIVPTTGAAPQRRLATPSVLARQYAFYFGAIQARITEVMCRSTLAEAMQEEMLLRIWLDQSGIIVHTDLLSGAGDRAGDFTNALRGLAVLVPPPAGMPQPVTLVIFPPSVTIAGCVTAGHRRRVN